MAAARSIVGGLDLPVDDAIVLQNSNKLTVRLLPVDAVARVAPGSEAQVAQLEVEVAQRLGNVGGPVAALDPRLEPIVYENDGFLISFWTHYESVLSRPVPPAEYATALEALHVGLRKIDLPAPRFTDRVDSARRLVARPGPQPRPGRRRSGSPPGRIARPGPRGQRARPRGAAAAR